MITLSEIEAQAMALDESERAELASILLRSLPSSMEDEDEDDAEAMRRDEEMDRDPSVSLSLEEFKRVVGR